MARVYRRKLKLRRKYAKRAMKKLRRPRLYENTFSFRRQCQILRITQTALNTVVFNDVAQPWIYTTNTAITSDSMTNTIQWGTAMQFKLNQAIQHGDFTALFDRYKINAIKLKVMYQASEATPGGGGVLPIFNYALDYDDDAVPASVSAILAKQKSKSLILSANRPVNIMLRPKVPTAIQWGTAALSTLGLGVSKAMYINSTYDAAPHFGVKFWINNMYTPSGANNQITIQPTFYLSCKDPQ